MNRFFVTLGRAAANVVDGTLALSKKAYVESGRAGTSVVAGWRSQRALNRMARQGIEVIELRPWGQA